jgi:NitT/TauT family transport system substrate-binding protein
MRFRRWLLCFPSLLLAALAACGGASAPAQSRQHIVIGYSSAAPTMMPVQIANATGAYLRNGLDPEFIFGPDGIKGVISGDIQATVTSTEEVINADTGGADLQIVAVMQPNVGQDFLVRPEIKTMADLKGKPVGITRRGTVTETVARMAARDGGLNPDRDLQLVELGSADKELAAMTAGALFGASFSHPNSDIAISQGAHVLYAYTTKKIPYPAAVVIVSKEWAQKNKPAVLALLRSLGEAVSTIQTQPEEAAKIFGQWAKTDDDNAKLAVELATSMIPLKMYPIPEGIKAVQAVVAERNPAVAQIDPARFYDDSYVKQLDSEGFYDKLPQKAAAS